MYQKGLKRLQEQLTEKHYEWLKDKREYGFRQLAVAFNKEFPEITEIGNSGNQIDGIMLMECT
jgi:hypothetical protein